MHIQAKRDQENLLNKITNQQINNDRFYIIKIRRILHLKPKFHISGKTSFFYICFFYIFIRTLHISAFKHAKFEDVDHVN